MVREEIVNVVDTFMIWHHYSEQIFLSLCMSSNELIFSLKFSFLFTSVSLHHDERLDPFFFFAATKLNFPPMHLLQCFGLHQPQLDPYSCTNFSDSLYFR